VCPFGKKQNTKMLAYSAVIWPVARPATKSDGYRGSSERNGNMTTVYLQRTMLSCFEILE